MVRRLWRKAEGQIASKAPKGAQRRNALNRGPDRTRGLVTVDDMEESERSDDSGQLQGRIWFGRHTFAE